MADCEQEVWRRVIKGRFKFRSIQRHGSLSAWLRKLTYRVASDAIRRESKHPTQPLDAVSDDLVEQQSDTERAFESQEALDGILGFVAKVRCKLSEASFQVFRLRALEGCNEQETAKALGLTRYQVRYRLLRARKKVRHLVASYLRERNLFTK